MFRQILPVSIKSLAGSVATLANWLGAWAVTMTASLMLSWSNGGTLLSLLLKSISFPLQHQIWPFLVLIRNFCYLCCRVYHGSHFCVLVGAGDQRKNARGNCIFIPLKQSNVLRPSIMMKVRRSPHVLSGHAIWEAEPMKSAAILQPCFVWMYHLVCLCKLYNMIL